MPDTTCSINPDSLKFFRKRRGISQQQLADAIKCTKDTVSRWERGKIQHVRSHLRKPLCNTLGIKWEQLTKGVGDTGDTRDIRLAQFADYMWGGIVKVPMRQNTLNSLRLVAARFNVGLDVVMGLAPLLFLIAAERSLLERNRRLEEMYAALNEAEKKLSDNSAHLGGVVCLRHDLVETCLDEESKSLEKRDIFGYTLEYENQDLCDEGPFVHFVRGLAKGLPEGAVTNVESASFHDDIIDSRIAEDTLRECTGISGDEESDEKLLDYIYRGNIDFARCLRMKRDKEEEDYRQWLSEELARIEENPWIREQKEILDGIFFQGGEL